MDQPRVSQMHTTMMAELTRRGLQVAALIEYFYTHSSISLEQMRGIIGFYDTLLGFGVTRIDALEQFWGMRDFIHQCHQGRDYNARVLNVQDYNQLYTTLLFYANALI